MTAKSVKVSRDWSLPSLKLTASLPLKINGWKMYFLLGWPIFRGELLVLGTVAQLVFESREGHGHGPLIRPAISLGGGPLRLPWSWSDKSGFFHKEWILEVWTTKGWFFSRCFPDTLEVLRHPFLVRVVSEFHHYFSRGKNHLPKGTTIFKMVATTSRGYTYHITLIHVKLTPRHQMARTQWWMLPSNWRPA